MKVTFETLEIGDIVSSVRSCQGQSMIDTMNRDQRRTTSTIFKLGCYAIVASNHDIRHIGGKSPKLIDVHRLERQIGNICRLICQKGVKLAFC